MKYSFTFFFLLFCFTLSAQTSSSPKTLSLGYFGEGGIRSGGIAGLMIPVKPLKSGAEFQNTLYIHPQLGAYTRKNFYTGLIFQMEAALKRQRTGKVNYQAFSLGLAYLNVLEVVSLTVDLQGDITKKERENRSFVLPTLGYEFGRTFRKRTQAFVQISYGMKFSGDFEPQGNLYLKLGLKYDFLKNQNDHG